MTMERILKFAESVCNAWEPAGCVMTEHPELGPCTQLNCSVLPLATKLLAQLDARHSFKPTEAKL